MKIVINETQPDSLNGGLIFEADIFHSGQNPSISFWDNTDGSITLNLHFWDSKEINDGYTIEKAQEMVATLSCAIEYVKNYYSDDGQMNLFDIGETDGQE